MFQCNELLNTLKRAKALFYQEALARFGHTAIKEAADDGYITTMPTEMGEVIYLSRTGRIYMDMKSPYHPSEQAASNSALLASLDFRFQKALGIEVSRPRKYAIEYPLNGKRVIGLARKDGFNRTTLRRLYEQNILSGHFDEMHIFLYNAEEAEMRRQCKWLFDPAEQKTPVSREAVRLYSVQVASD